jgi:hypothetical protein
MPVWSCRGPLCGSGRRWEPGVEFVDASDVEAARALRDLWGSTL